MFLNEREAEQYIKSELNSAIHLKNLDDKFIVLQSKGISDIVICKNKFPYGVFFIEIKFYKPNNNRIGFGNGSGEGIQPEILSRQPHIMEENMRWVFVSENSPSEFILKRNSEVIPYVSGNSTGIKQNNIKPSIFNGSKRLNLDGLINEIINWLSTSPGQETDYKIVRDWKGWEKAIKARIDYIHTDEENYNELLEYLPTDGMIYFEMGMAFEIKENYSKAISFYEKAKELFPLQTWKEISADSLKRIENRNNEYRYKKASKWYFIFELSQISNLTPKRYMDIVSDLSHVYYQTNISIAVLRIFLEEVVEEIYSIKKLPNLNQKNYINLESIVHLFDKSIIPPNIKDKMIRIYNDSSTYIHPSSQNYQRDKLDVIVDFIDVIKFYYQNFHSPK
jgi:tetratricopeptide (TPR) repeat protein